MTKHRRLLNSLLVRLRLLNEKSEAYKIAVISNTTVNQFKEILEYSLQINNVHIEVQVGDYDNIIQDSLKFNQTNAVFVFWEVSNLIERLLLKTDYKIISLDNYSSGSKKNHIKDNRIKYLKGSTKDFDSFFFKI